MSDIDKFRNLYRCEIGDGKRYYKRLPMSYVDYINASPVGVGPSIMDLQTHEETGVRLEMASSDFERLMVSALEGEDHHRFREMHPAAKELYEEYMVMFLMTKKYKE